MSQRTQVFKVMPWTGGINTSLDPSMIPANQLTIADHVTYDTRDSKRNRDGINHNWDSGTNGTATVIGGIDFWHGNPRTQLQVSVFSDGTIYSYTNSGTRTQLTDIGQAWSGTLTTAKLHVFGNKVFFAVSGSNNSLKFWDGANSVQDVPASYGLTSVSRASAGTTRTLVFNRAFPGAVASKVVVLGSGSGSYNGTFTVASVTTTTVANDTITYTGVGSLTESTTADTGITVGAQAPFASTISEHLSRLVCNDKNNPDLFHFSATGDYTTWLGWGDSGAIPVGDGDGDPVGIQAISPTFKGQLFFGKKTKLYRMMGYSPEDFQFEKMTNGLGVVGPNAFCAVDEEDLFFVSDKGVHSVAATAAYGDFQGAFVSADIQRSFNGFNRSRLQQVWASYLSNINSIAFTFSTAGVGRNDQLWLYNVPKKAWYTWSGVSCDSIWLAEDSDTKRFYIGTNVGRVSKTFVGSNYDTTNSGVQQRIDYHLTTGNIYPAGDAYTMVALKRLIIFYKPTGTYTLTVNVYVDNYQINPENSLNFSDISSTALVGSTFITGQSIVGAEVVLGPYSRTIDGVGRGCKIDIRQSSLNASVEIQGFAIEYEVVGTVPEIFLS